MAQPIEADVVPATNGLCGCKRKQGGPGATCKRQAGWGTPHLGVGPCRVHGGNIPNVVKHYEAVVIENQARQLFGKHYDPTPITNPLDSFAEVAGSVMGWMQLMQRIVADLDSPRYALMTGEQIRGEVQLFERAMDRCNTVLSTYARLNIDDRLAKISAAQSYMVMQAIEAALAAAGVSGARAIEAKKAAASRLRVEPASTT